MKVLGIETSCDETGVAIYSTSQGLLAEALFSQVEMHGEYGGVVPELASRDHVRKAVPLIREVMAEAGCQGGDIDGVAYTRGPGLVGALLVGVTLGRSLAWGWAVPCVGVHHMEGHLLAPMLESSPPAFPFIALLVSGGHTQLVEVEGVGHYRILGETLDDAAGEAFDKTAKLLGLGYPGGPALSALAEQGRAGLFEFPRPMVNRPGLDFSFSGLKTAALNAVGEGCLSEQTRADVARAFVEAVVDTLVIKCRRAVRQTGIHTLVAAGGVSANRQLRQALARLAGEEGLAVHYPRAQFCTDNGAMIAYVGSLRLAAGQHQGLGFDALPRWPMEELPGLD